MPELSEKSGGLARRNHNLDMHGRWETGYLDIENASEMGSFYEQNLAADLGRELRSIRRRKRTINVHWGRSMVPKEIGKWTPRGYAYCRGETGTRSQFGLTSLTRAQSLLSRRFFALSHSCHNQAQLSSSDANISATLLSLLCRSRASSRCEIVTLFFIFAKSSLKLSKRYMRSARSVSFNRTAKHSTFLINIWVAVKKGS